MGCPIIRTTVCSSQKMSGQLRAFSISTKPVLFFKFEDVLQSIVVPQDDFAQPQRIDGDAIFFESVIRFYFPKDLSINLFSIIDHCLLQIVPSGKEVSRQRNDNPYPVKCRSIGIPRYPLVLRRGDSLDESVYHAPLWCSTILQLRRCE